MFHLASSEPRRPPFSDWRAQVERHIEQRTGWVLSLRGFNLESYYNVGMSPREVASDWLAEGKPHA